MKQHEPTLSSKGFTLIELLVVIAIIGLLAAVVLASVGGARNKGADATVKSQLNAARSQAELFAANNGNIYTGVCLATQANNGLASILANADAAIAGGAAVCNDAANVWAASAPLTTASTYWCVDSIGNSKQTTTALGAATVCP